MIDERKVEKDCNQENFLSEEVLKKFKTDNVKMASFLRKVSGIQKNNIWKPDKFNIRADLERDIV